MSHQAHQPNGWDVVSESLTESADMPRLFSCYGVELEYMLVDAQSLDVRPIADELLTAVAGEITSAVQRGPVSWSNELTMHIIEIKCTDPVTELSSLTNLFQENVTEANRLLAERGAMLLPSGMHPWMDPFRETRLWPHDYNAVYEAFNRIFNCQGHGWSNLQSTHLNLPFSGDDEFGRLHAAIRLVLPLLPALAASSPVMDGRVTGVLDNRLEVYRTNSRKIPQVAGAVIPEPAYTASEYQQQILQPLYREIGPVDPDGVLQEEWLNARGAVARFSRDSIEIRELDIQECPAADLGICQLIVALLQALVEETWSNTRTQRGWDTQTLHGLLLRVIRHGDQTEITDANFLGQFGLVAPQTASSLWKSLAERLAGRMSLSAESARALEVIHRAGPLARRLTEATGPHPDRARLTDVYRHLAECLARGDSFSNS